MDALEGSTDLEKLESQDFRNINAKNFGSDALESPRTRHKILQLHEEDKSQNLMHSCCGGYSDKRLVILLTQVSVSILVLSFSGGMLAMSDEPNDKAIYMSLISSTLSYWLGKNDGERK
tara:strand:+ start:331 stop:687 length:357 start_codon:yes stop_codon:yes gene_type:complete